MGKNAYFLAQFGLFDLYNDSQFCAVGHCLVRLIDSWIVALIVQIDKAKVIRQKRLSVRSYFVFIIYVLL
jgi:hypothetical protein